MTKKYIPTFTFTKILESSKKMLLEVWPIVPTAKRMLALAVPISTNGTPLFSTIRDSALKLDAWYWWFNHGRKHIIETAESVSFSVANDGGASSSNNGNSNVNSCTRRWNLKSVICQFLAEIGFQIIRQDYREYKPWGNKQTKVVYTIFAIPGSNKILAEPELQECRSLLFESREAYENSVLDNKLVTLEYAKKLNHKRIKGTNTYSLSDEIWQLIYSAKRKGLLK